MANLSLAQTRGKKFRQQEIKLISTKIDRQMDRQIALLKSIAAQGLGYGLYNTLNTKIREKVKKKKKTILNK